MARLSSLSKLSMDDLIKMREDVEAALSGKAAMLKQQLAALEEIDAGAVPARKGMKGGKIAPKYRGPNGETWAGRGVEPTWLRDAVKAGKKREDFLIGKPLMPVKKAGKKKGIEAR
jgi:DNA-binding protein H-NS